MNMVMWMLRWRRALRMVGIVSPVAPASKVRAIRWLPGAARTTSAQPPEGGLSPFTGVGGWLASVGEGPAGMRVGRGVGVVGVMSGSGVSSCVTAVGDGLGERVSVGRGSGVEVEVGAVVAVG